MYSIYIYVDEISPLYHLTILSGPIAILTVVSAECLIPAHNVFEEPQYWYEYQLILAFGLIPFLFGDALIKALYWSDFSFEKKWISYAQIIGISLGVYVIGATAYHLIWTLYLQYVPPLPLSLYVAGCPSFLASLLTTGYR